MAKLPRKRSATMLIFLKTSLASWLFWAEFTILVNSAQNSQEAKEVFKKISMVADRFLGNLAIDYLGFIPFDEKLPLAVKHQRPVLEIYPQAPSSRSFVEVARILAEKPLPEASTGNVRFFWGKIFHCHQAEEKERGT